MEERQKSSAVSGISDLRPYYSSRGWGYFPRKKSPKKKLITCWKDEEHAYSPLAFAAEHTKMILGFIIISS